MTSITTSENTPDQKTGKWSSGSSVERMQAQVPADFSFEVFLFQVRLGDSLIGQMGKKYV